MGQPVLRVRIAALLDHLKIVAHRAPVVFIPVDKLGNPLLIEAPEPNRGSVPQAQVPGRENIVIGRYEGLEPPSLLQRGNQIPVVAANLRLRILASDVAINPLLILTMAEALVVARG